ERTVRPHLFALEKLGVGIKALSDSYEISVKKLKPAEIVLYESGDTATENVIMAASKIDGVTVIKFASANYMVQDLCYFLSRLGIKIDGIGTHILTVYGQSNINLDVEYSISEDPIDSMLFISAAVTTNSSIDVERCPIDFLDLELLKLEKMGLKYKILRRYKGENGQTNLADVRIFKHKKLKALDEKIYARPFPGLNIDNLPFFVPIASKAHGRTFIHDWVYENRAIYYTELSKLGAQIDLIDSHRVHVTGPINFKPSEIVSPPALRPAAIILIGMLAAPGASVFRNVYTISRGYEDIRSKLNSLGAKIEMF
ncbi:MAG TPA: UDP-N-acetylglucosamine 1-carboxyvinyltransferase, partial [Candidatus Paceibacterota bacterium]